MNRDVNTRMKESVKLISAYANGLIDEAELEEMLDILLIHPAIIN